MIPRRLSFLFLIFFFLDSIRSASSHRASFSEDDERALSEFEEFLEWKKMKKEHGSTNSGIKISENPFRNENLKQRTFFTNKYVDNLRRRFSIERLTASIDPPPIDQPARMARFVVNQADWTAVGTISSRKDTLSYPNANLVSVADGPLGNGSGIPYVYLTPLDFTAQDLAIDNRATFLMSLAEGSYCTGKNYDPMDPRCARVLLTGKVVKVTNSSADYEAARRAVFTRHPTFPDMPDNHHFFFAKLDIASVVVLDTFGGPKYVSIPDYLNPPSEHISPSYSSNNWLEEDTSFEGVERKTVYRV